MVRGDRRSIHVEGGQKAGRGPPPGSIRLSAHNGSILWRAENSGRRVGAKEIVAKVAAKVKVSPGLEGEAEDLWSAARLGALTVYLGQVSKITAKGPKTHPGRMGFGPQNTLIRGMIS